MLSLLVLELYESFQCWISEQLMSYYVRWRRWSDRVLNEKFVFYEPFPSSKICFTAELFPISTSLMMKLPCSWGKFKIFICPHSMVCTTTVLQYSRLLLQTFSFLVANSNSSNSSNSSNFTEILLHLKQLFQVWKMSV